MAEAAGKLAGITVLNLASVGPAARAARMLADYGARVIQVGPTSSKGAKQIDPPFHSYGAGRGFERLRIDLRADTGRETFLRLVERADVLIESYRPGVAERLGIGFEAVRRRSPRIVYCSTSGYGQDGPSAGWAGHDINYLAMGGYLSCSEPRRDGGPPIPGATVADSAGGGMQAVIAILAALVRRGIDDAAQYLDVAAVEGVVSLMSLALDQYLATGEVAGPRRTLLTGRYAFYDVYRCRDGRFISVGAIEPRFYRNLCEGLGLPHLVAHQMDDARQDEIREAFREVFARRDRDAWVDDLAAKDTCVAPVLELPEVAADPHLRARGVFMEVEHPDAGRLEQVAPVLAGGERDGGSARWPAADGRDADRLLGEAGLDQAGIARLRAEGVIE